MKNELPDEQLTTLLHGWRVDAEPALSFSQNVWRRVAQRKAAAAAARWPARLHRWISSLNARTEYALGAAVAVVVTVGAGWLGLQPGPSHAVSPSPSTYLTSIDPYRMIR